MALALKNAGLTSSFFGSIVRILRIGDGDRTRTCNLLLRRQLLYPVELHHHGAVKLRIVGIYRAKFNEK